MSSPATGKSSASPQPSSATGTLAFPTRPALALGVAVSTLLAAHFLSHGSTGLSPAILPQTAALHLPHPPAPMVGPVAVPQPVTSNSAAAVAAQPYNGVQLTPRQAAAHTDATAPGITAVGAPAVQAGEHTQILDASGSLAPLYKQLWALESKTAPVVVTVLHYGDSPTTADLITGDVRALLQGRFGDAGKGFNLGAKPWAWYGHRDVEISDKGWASSQKDATPVGRMKPSVYGIGGAIFAGGAGATTTYTLRGAPQTAVDIDWVGSPGTLKVLANGNELTTLNTAGNGPMDRAVSLPTGTTSVKLEVESGTVKLAGVDFRRGSSGVVYDSMGLNGATTTVLSRTFDTSAWAAEVGQVKPSLIVINYGTNESQFAGLVDTLPKELRAAIDKTRAAAPGVPILVMSPMDRGEHGGLNDIHTNPLIPKIVSIQQQIAAEEHCAFFNTYAAMGGDGTMARWYAAKPRLITADLIHPTPQGAEYVAQLLVGALYSGYDGWKAANGIGVVKVEDPVVAAAARRAEAETRRAEMARARAGKRGPATQPRRTPADNVAP